ncbi:unnamed protein product [[Actinomadura] parvosata subsp. kistnae]|nr:unnamed protein product [Actinomadura parvosata subsp. kistnae]
MRPPGGPALMNVPDLFPHGATELHRIAMQQLAPLMGDA